MESMTSQGGAGDSMTRRLREENARLSTSVAVLEERLKEAESRYQRDLQSERTHLESLLVSHLGCAEKSSCSARHVMLC